MDNRKSEGQSDIDRSKLTGYAAITVVYWSFMLTDGALRMLVLLHFHTLGFSPLQLAYLFLVYEALGLLTNITAGWLGKRIGIQRLITAGLALQIVALSCLLYLDPEWPVWVSVLWTMLAQGLSGCAKDLTKTGAKSALKLLLPDGNQQRLFKWVTLLTGSKNAVKGLGFFVGAALLAAIGFKPALVVLLLVLIVAMAGFTVTRTIELGKPSINAKFSDIFATSESVNRLSSARVFLFAARDTWFVVSLPVFLYTSLTTLFQIENKYAFTLSGTFMACWVIGYGYVQAMTSVWFKKSVNETGKVINSLKCWCRILCLFTLGLALFVWLLTKINGDAQSAISAQSSFALVATVVIGLLIFGAVFAINSALHSYLILAFTNQQRATMDVGFYYMANAGGRLLGTLLSGLTFQLGGLPASLTTAGILLYLSYVFALRIDHTIPTTENS